MSSRPQPPPNRAAPPRWLRIGRAVVAKAAEGPGPLLRAIGRTLWRTLPAGWRGGRLRRFRGVADLRFTGPEPGVERAGHVSVILPVYDQAALLGDAVASVLAQTHADLELIVLDDGSRDDVAAALAPFRDDRRLRHLRQSNQGLPKALSSAFECATGEFCTWTSADNLMHPQQLERLIAFLRERPEQAMVFADYELIDDRGEPLRDGDFRILDRTDRDDRAIVRVDRRVDDLHRVADNFVGGCFLYRGRAGRLLGDYSPVLGLEDYDYWLRLDRLLGLSHLGTREVLYRYRVHDNTLTARSRELRLRELAVALLQRERRRAAWFAAPCRILADGECLSWVRAAAGHVPVDELRPGSLPAPQDALIVCAAARLAELDLEALPPSTMVAAHFGSVADVWRHGRHLHRGRCIALGDDAAIGARLAVFTRTAFVAAAAGERLELALRHRADRTFFASDDTAQATGRVVPTPASPAALRVRCTDAAVAGPLAAADGVTVSDDGTADAVIGDGRGAAAAAARGELFLAVIDGPGPTPAPAEAAHVRAWLASDPAALARAEAECGADPGTLVWLPPGADLSRSCVHLARWLLQGGTVAGVRAHLRRSANAQLP
ncbi:MAG: glycosyltransferase family 2 protein [Planctomycetes bacterium]|nr:glycosyltransferase family 2 protein [Planctomycetota bacterium]